jgi:site-specific DNA-methyltransferase (adenine-specific)
MTKQTNNEIVLVSTDKLVFNQTICEIYSTPENYLEIKKNIQDLGIIQPLLVNESDFQVISGNIRLKIAIELGYKAVPVIFKNLSADELRIISFSSNHQRQKSVLDKWNERQFIKKYFNIKQGSRTDLNEQLKEESLVREELSKGISTYENNSFAKIEKLAKVLHGENYQEVIEKELSTTESKKTVSLNGLTSRLEKEVARKVNNLKVPKSYEIKEDDFKVYNHTCENMHELEDKSVASIVTSPPYFQMRDYGNGSFELGLENDRNEYIQNLINIFTECRRVLKDDGSLMVNINEKVESGAYRAVSFQFVLEMLKNGWRLNDEIIWIKNNVVYTVGKRTVRSHEYIYHFVKSDATDFYYDDSIVKMYQDENGDYVYGDGKKVPKFKSGMDFTNGRIRTNAANTQELRNQCKNAGFHLTHSATFPASIPGILVLLTSKEGDVVLDPFNGTGTVGEVCRVTGRKYVGYELNPEFIMATVVRMKNSTLDMNILPHNFLSNEIKLAC